MCPRLNTSRCFPFLLIAAQTAHKYRCTRRALATQMWGNVFKGGKSLGDRAGTRGWCPGLFKVNRPVNKHGPLQDDNGANGPFCRGYKKKMRKQVGDLCSKKSCKLEKFSSQQTVRVSPEGLKQELNSRLEPQNTLFTLDIDGYYCMFDIQLCNLTFNPVTNQPTWKHQPVWLITKWPPLTWPDCTSNTNTGIKLRTGQLAVVTLQNANQRGTWRIVYV